jgi:hypothetical protein
VSRCKHQNYIQTIIKKVSQYETPSLSGVPGGSQVTCMS